MCMIVYSVLNGLSVTALIPAFDNIISGKGITIPPDANIPVFKEIIRCTLLNLSSSTMLQKIEIRESATTIINASGVADAGSGLG